MPALQGLDAEDRTVYLGTLSKTLFPSLRLGYLVVPTDLVHAFVAAKALMDRHAPAVEQAVLATFITECSGLRIAILISASVPYQSQSPPMK